MSALPDMSNPGVLKNNVTQNRETMLVELKAINNTYYESLWTAKIYEMDGLYSGDSKSDNTIIHNLHRSYLYSLHMSTHGAPHKGLIWRWGWGIQYRKGSGLVALTMPCQPCVAVSPLPPYGENRGWHPPTKNTLLFYNIHLFFLMWAGFDTFLVYFCLFTTCKF